MSRDTASPLERLIHIATLLQGPKKWRPEDLHRECKISQRQVYRDLKILRQAGIPIEYDRRAKSYRISRSVFMPPLDLTFDEAWSLVALVENIAKREQIPMTRPAAMAMEKLRAMIPATLRDELQAMDDCIEMQLAKSNPPDGVRDVFETMRQAIQVRTRLQCRYESIAKEKHPKPRSLFCFDPYTLFFSQRAWYIVGFHHGHQAMRSMKLTRFESVKRTRENYTIPESFNVEQYLGNAWRMIRGDKRYDIVLDIDADFAETIIETQWHTTQEFSYQRDGSVQLTFKVDGLEEIIWWVLSLGPHCKVRKPLALAERVKQLACEMANLYTETRKRGKKSSH